MSTVGDRLREERKRLGLSQTALAKAAGVHLNTQSRYENGDRVPDTAYLEAIGKEGVDLIYVLHGIGRGFSEEQARDPALAAFIAGEGDYAGEFGRDFFLTVLGITRSDWEAVVRRNLRRIDPDKRGEKDRFGVYAFACSPWGADIAKASSVFSSLLNRAVTLDSDMLAKVLQVVDYEVAEYGKAVTAAKKAQIVAMIYRAARAGEEVDPVMVQQAVKLAAS